MTPEGLCQGSILNILLLFLSLNWIPDQLLLSAGGVVISIAFVLIIKLGFELLLKVFTPLIVSSPFLWTASESKAYVGQGVI